MQRGEKIILFNLNFKRLLSFVVILFNVLYAIDYINPKFNNVLNDSSIVFGCMDDSMCNFGSGPVECACNYDEYATQDTLCIDTNGICNYAVFPSNPNIDETLGSCTYNRDCSGNCLGEACLADANCLSDEICIDGFCSSEGNSIPVIDECGVCDTNDANNNLSCLGCTDPQALNYNPFVDSDDGSCNYERPEQQWNIIYGDDDYDMTSSLQITNDGGYVIAGYRGELEESDFYLLKMDSDGLLEWEMTYGGDDRDIAFSVLETNDAGYIITGYTKSYGSGNNDIWVVKTDENGQTCDYSENGNCYTGTSTWVRTFGNGLNQSGRAMVQFDNGTGTKFAILSQEEINNTDIGLYIIDSNGDEIGIQRYYGGNQTDIGYSIIDANDGFVIVGYTKSYGNGSPGDIWMIKTNYEGSSCVLGNYNEGLYDKYNDSCHSEEFEDLNENEIWDVEEDFTDENGNGVWDDADADEHCNGNCYNDEDNSWARTYGGLGTDYALSIDLNYENNFEQTTGNHLGYILTGATNSFSENSFDLWLIKTDINGNTCDYNYIEDYYDLNNNDFYDESEPFIDLNNNLVWDNYYGRCYNDDSQWVNYFGSSNDDIGRSVKSTLDKGYIIAGEIETDFEKEDAWIIKVTESGIKLWDYQLGGNKKDVSKSIVVEPNGYIFAGGSVSFSENEKMDITLTKLATDDCSYLGDNAVKDECGTCCNCKTVEDYTDSNSNGRYDDGEPYIDFNNNDIYDEYVEECVDNVINNKFECSYYVSPDENGGQYDCSGTCFGGARLDDDNTYGTGEPFVDFDGDGQYDGPPYETFTDCNWNLTICQGDDLWHPDMGNGEWNTNPLEHCCEDIYRDDCGECYGDNVGCAEIIINEIMNNPSIVIDAMGEWFELYNNEESPISLEGWRISDEHDPPEDQFIIDVDLIIPPKGYVVLGNNADFETNGGIIVDYEYSNLDFSLFNGEDAILLQSQKTDNVWSLRDAVIWSQDAIYNVSGKSQSLNGAENFIEYYDQDSNLVTLRQWNDLATNWETASRQNGNGIYDAGEIFFDCHQTNVNNTYIEICENDINWVDGWGNDIYDDGEPFIDDETNGDNNSFGRPNFDSDFIVGDYQCFGDEGCSNYVLEEECPLDCIWDLVTNDINELVFSNVMVTDSENKSISFTNDGYGTMIINDIELNSEYYQSNKIFDLYSCSLEQYCARIDNEEDCSYDVSDYEQKSIICKWLDLSEWCDDTNLNGCEDHEVFIDCGFDDNGNYICEDEDGWDPSYGNGIWDARGQCSYECDQLHYVLEDETINLNISFNPGEIASYSGELIIQTNDFENLTNEIELTGNGIGMSSQILTDEILYFGVEGHLDNCLGCNAFLNIQNIGVEALEIEEFGLLYGNLFYGDLNSFYTVEPNFSLDFEISFNDSLFNIDSYDSLLIGEQELVLDCMPFTDPPICEAEWFHSSDGDPNYDLGEPYYDLDKNGVYSPASNGWYDSEQFVDCGLDSNYVRVCEGDDDWDPSYGNGVWDNEGGIEEEYIDVNDNGIYDNYNDNIWDPNDFYLDCGPDQICPFICEGHYMICDELSNEDSNCPNSSACINNPEYIERDYGELDGIWNCRGEYCADQIYYDKLFIYSNEPGNISEVTLIAEILHLIYYDLNNDNRTDILDIINIVEASLGLIELNNGDFNFDGSVNIIDVTILIEFILMN